MISESLLKRMSEKSLNNHCQIGYQFTMLEFFFNEIRLCARTIVKWIFNNSFEPETVVKYSFSNNFGIEPLIKVKKNNFNILELSKQYMIINIERTQIE
jgi:hypothetical protein